MAHDVRLEFRDQASQKFWQVHQEGTEVTTSWGKLGTDGQTKTKSYDSPAAAQKDAESQVRAKVSKGYVVAGGGPAAGGRAAVASAATADAKPRGKAKARGASPPGTLLDALLAYAHSDEDRAVAKALAAAAGKHHELRADGTIASFEVKGRRVDFTAPHAGEGYERWPASFRAFIAAHADVSLEDDGDVGTFIGTQGDGGLDSLDSLLEGTALEGREDEVHCPAQDGQNWWIYHPGDLNGEGEPRLHFLDHGGGFGDGPSHDHLGSLTLTLLADKLGVEVVEATAADDTPVQIQKVATLHRPVRYAAIEGDLLFTTEGKVKDELLQHYPDGFDRLVAYDLKKPKSLVALGMVPLPHPPYRFVIVGQVALVLTVDWEARRFELVEVDIADPAKMKVNGCVHRVDIPEKRSLAEAGSDSRLTVVSPKSVAVHYYLNHRELDELRLLERAGGAWKEVAAGRLDIDEQRSFFVPKGVAVGLDAIQALYGDERWAVVGDYAIVSESGPPHLFSSLKADGSAGKPLRFSRDGHSVQLTTRGDLVLVASSKGVSLIRVAKNGTLSLNTTYACAFPKSFGHAGPWLWLNHRADAKATPGKEFSFELCRLT